MIIHRYFFFVLLILQFSCTSRISKPIIDLDDYKELWGDSMSLHLGEWSAKDLMDWETPSNSVVFYEKKNPHNGIDSIQLWARGDKNDKDIDYIVISFNNEKNIEVKDIENTINLAGNIMNDKKNVDFSTFENINVTGYEWVFDTLIFRFANYKKEDNGSYVTIGKSPAFVQAN